MTQKVKERRKRVIESLTNQLSSGVKPNKKGIVPADAKFDEDVARNPTKTNIIKKYPTLPLSQSDISRINKEVEVLKTRI